MLHQNVQRLNQCLRIEVLEIIFWPVTFRVLQLRQGHWCQLKWEPAPHSSPTSAEDPVQNSNKFKLPNSHEQRNLYNSAAPAGTPQNSSPPWSQVNL